MHDSTLIATLAHAALGTTFTLVETATL